MKFCHIAPTELVPLAMTMSNCHLTLAHLIEKDPLYTRHYKDSFFIANNEEPMRIMDNSGFEFFKERGPGWVFEPSKLLDLAVKVDTDYIVLPDYPGQKKEDTIAAAEKYANQFIEAGFGTFFVPQGRAGNIEEYVECFQYAVENPEINYIGVSILAVPIAFDVEQNNKLQRYNSRFEMMSILEDRGLLRAAKRNNKMIHFLGMVDGPKEISLCGKFFKYIDSWDSSAACWAGLNNVRFDNSPTGLRDGKIESSVNFNFRFSSQNTSPSYLTYNALYNMKYINNLIEALEESNGRNQDF